MYVTTSAPLVPSSASCQSPKDSQTRQKDEVRKDQIRQSSSLHHPFGVVFYVFICYNYMVMKILQSASKIVFVLMSLAVIAGLFLGKIDPKDFMILASMAFTFYFSAKGDPTQTFAGK